MYRSGKRARAVEWKIWRDAPQPCEARARILLRELVPLTTVLLSQMGQMDMEIEEKCLL